MIRPFELALRAPRHAPFSFSINLVGVDLYGGAGAAQIRLYSDAPGAALVDLTPTISVNRSGAAPVSTVSLQASKATMEGLPAAAEVGDDLDLAWDLQITPASSLAAVWFRGVFTVEAGVTR